MSYNPFTSAPNDKENATFRHVAHTLSGHKIVGYSKKVGFNETADKRRLFVTSMARLIPGFFSKRNDVWQVEVFRRLPERTNGMYKEARIALFTSGDFQLLNGFEKDSAISQCMRSLYDGDVKGCNDLLKTFNDFVFDPKRETYEDLYKRCSNLLNFHERGVVERFFWEIKKRYFAEVPVNPVKNEPAPQPTAYQAPARTRETAPLSGLINIALQQ
ncbi:hypothetical protein [Arsenicibacter rosenii]|uniref:Uncharacterized protein n=1 Tax=Arsenicibacter rosenii TaxID=1750698 RepID=A0A1S2VCI3_9BACT|nr:hypothetical protein [Arsenicibacter rosenii]OIN55638.1 hypothetical protein BLX24_29070 [Arsenicibacter rosenii]